MRNTKEIIWKEALTLFSQYGYEGVSVKVIAEAVGIKDSSLYKHFKSKQEIFNTILEEASKKMVEAQNSLTIQNSANVANKYVEVNLAMLSNMCFNLFNFYLRDEMVSKFRKMLIMEQYSRSAASNLFQKLFIDDVLEYERSLFSQLINKGFFVNGDPYIMALHFYSPLFLLLFKLDLDSIKSEELKKIINDHVTMFAKNYVDNKNE